MKFIKKLNYLLSSEFKKEAIAIFFLLIIGMFFEVGGVGILFPFLKFLLDTTSLRNGDLKYLFDTLGFTSNNQIVLFGLVILIIFNIIKAFYLVYLSYRQSKFSSDFANSLSKELYSGYLDLPYKFHLNRNPNQLQKNIQLDIFHLGGIVLAIMTLMTEMASIIGISFFLFYMEPIGATLLFVYFFTFIYLLNRITKHRIVNLGKKRNDYEKNAIKYLSDGLNGIKQIKLLNVESYYVDKFQNYDKLKSKINTNILVFNAIPRQYLELLIVFAISAAISIMVASGNLLITFLPILGIFLASAFRLIPSINKIITSLQTISYINSIFESLVEEFELIRKNKVTNSNTKPLTAISKLVISELVYSYPDSQTSTINGISLEVFKGQFVGIIGKSGAGKSTLIDLIAGLVKPNSGYIKYDDIDIFENLNSWQSSIAYVPQNVFLTDDSLAENIALGINVDQIDFNALNNAIFESQLTSVVEKLPNGLFTNIGERGIKLSGGERQRIGIARALYKNSPILILDEATSALDNLTEKHFMEAIIKLKGQKTVFIIAHRMSTVEMCDTIIEIEKGKLRNSFNNLK